VRGSPIDFSIRLQAIRERIGHAAERAGRPPADVRLLGASKTVSVEVLREFRSLGLHRFGENRVQEALPKVEALGSGVEWHFIGHLQKNKVKSVVGHFEIIHSLDSLGLAKAINQYCEKIGKGQPVLLEVNVSGESSKEGFNFQEVEKAVKALNDFPRVEVRGLMTVPPHASDPEFSRPYFRLLNGLRNKLEQLSGRPFPELSMGMSNDFEVAIEEGATIVRIGTALFGERPPVH